MLEPREQAKLIAASPRSDSVASTSSDISVWLNNSGGYIALNWINTKAVGRYDYIALYDKPPTDPNGYLTRQWHYASNQHSPYVTGTSALGTKGSQYWIAYCAYDYEAGKYEIVVTNGPTQP